jgi:hypothetical protein
MNKLWVMLYIWVLWWSLCSAFDVPEVLWSLVWGLVWVLVIAFVKALVSSVSNVASCHGLCVWTDVFVKVLAASVSNEASLPGLFVGFEIMAIIGTMCQFYVI